VKATVTTEILVAGAGPAGLTAGLYASRSGYEAVILEKSFTGGQMALTSDVENYPGFPEPVSGMALAQSMEKQATRFGCRVVNVEATGISSDPAGFLVTSTQDSFTARAVIICTGVKPRQLGAPGEQELIGRGVSYCAVCDGPLFKGREVAVVGGGDSALDEALYLSRMAARVHVIHRRDEFRGCKMALERLRRRENVVFHLSTIVTAVNGKNRLESLELSPARGAVSSTLPVSGLFVYIGSSPNTAWCSGFVKLDDTGSIVTDDRLRTNVPGVFAAGDVRNTRLRQIATSVGDGALAAMMADEYLVAKG